MTREEAIQSIIKENERRNAVIYAKFDPISGEGSIGKRKKVVIDDFPVSVQWLPVEMLRVPLVKQLVECGSIRSFLTDNLGVEYTDEDRLKVIEQFVRIRCRYDFAFWAATFVYIKIRMEAMTCFFVLPVRNDVLSAGLKNCAKQVSRYASSCSRLANGAALLHRSFIWLGCSSFTKSV